MIVIVAMRYGKPRDGLSGGWGKALHTRVLQSLMYQVMSGAPSTVPKILWAPADTCGAEHAPPAKPRLLELLAPPVHEAEGAALLHQRPRGEETLVHPARDAEAFSLLGAQAAARSSGVFVGEGAVGEDAVAGETGEGAVLFAVAGEGVRFDEEGFHLGAAG
jgi:hypothetical protein